jgi:hypothetical protein
MAHQYPRVGRVFRENVRGRGPRSICCACGKPVCEGEALIRADIQVSWFRGDDEVLKGHNSCSAGGVAAKVKANYGLELK